MFKKIIISVLVIGGLVAGLLLVKQRQELRRGATGEIVDLYLAPSAGVDLSSKVVGNKLKVVLLGNTNGHGIGGASLRVRYDKSKLKLTNATNVGTHNLFSGFQMKEVNDAEGLVDVIVAAMGDELTGVISVNEPMMWFDFEIKALGNARVWADLTWSDTTVFGIDSQGESYQIREFTGEKLDITYNLGGTGTTISPTNTATPSGSCKQLNEICFDGANTFECCAGLECEQAGSNESKCLQIPTALTTPGGPGSGGTPEPTQSGCRSAGQTCDANSVSNCCSGLLCRQDLDGGFVCMGPGTPTIQPTATPGGPGSGGTPEPTQSGCRSAGQTCSGTTSIGNCCSGLLCRASDNGDGQMICMGPGTPTIQPTPTTPEVTPTIPAGAKIVSFEVALAGVRDYSKCLGDNTVSVIMLKGNNRKEYKNVALVNTAKKTSKNERIFLVDKLDVSTFGETENVAIFVKGKRHLQMKYGINSQDKYYNEQGGVLNFNNTTIFDFSKYPVMAGDVNSDGKVDGVDFSIIKKDAAEFKQVAEGQYLQSDLDGSCVVNNGDVILLVQALDEKHDQMY